MGLGRPRAKWLRGQRWDGRGSVAASATGVSARAPAGREGQETGGCELCKKDADARRLLSLSRGHWGIENRLHWVRDVTFDEDRSQVRTGAAPQVLAGLRNLVISLVRRAGHSNVAAALRRHNAHLSEAFDMMGFS